MKQCIKLVRKRHGWREDSWTIEERKILLETKVTLILVLCDQVEVIEQRLKTKILSKFVRHTVKKLDFSQI